MGLGFEKLINLQMFLRKKMGHVSDWNIVFILSKSSMAYGSCHTQESSVPPQKCFMKSSVNPLKVLQNKIATISECKSILDVNNIFSWKHINFKTWLDISSHKNYENKKYNEYRYMYLIVNSGIFVQSSCTFLLAISCLFHGTIRK